MKLKKTERTCSFTIILKLQIQKKEASKCVSPSNPQDGVGHLISTESLSFSNLLPSCYTDRAHTSLSFSSFGPTSQGMWGQLIENYIRVTTVILYLVIIISIIPQLTENYIRKQGQQRSFKTINTPQTFFSLA